MLDKTVILHPMFALVAWTICVMLLLTFHHLKEAIVTKSVSKGDTSADSPHATSASTQANRNYMNLLEAPMLFYIASLLAYVTDTASWGIVAVAWTYVGLRVIHSIIHVTYNRVAHRALVFVGSMMVLGVLWLLIFIRIFQSASAA